LADNLIKEKQVNNLTHIYNTYIFSLQYNIHALFVFIYVYKNTSKDIPPSSNLSVLKPQCVFMLGEANKQMIENNNWQEHLIDRNSKIENQVRAQLVAINQPD